jgi:energy-coupling factor transporter ATP-binding protein EcfA2
VEEQRAHYVERLEVSGLGCFRGTVRLNLVDANGQPHRWTVIVGENGTGKTTLLRALAMLLPVPTAGDPLSVQPAGMVSGPPPLTAGSAEWSASAVLVGELFFRVNAVGPSIGTYSWSLRPWERVPTPLAYGAHRRASATELSDDLPGVGVETLLYDTAELINVEEWLLRLKLDTLLRDDPASASARELAAAQEVLPSLLPDVLRVDIPKPPPDRRPGDLRNLVAFHTRSDGVVPFSGLSLGYRTIAALAIDLAARLFRAWPDSPDPLAEPAICLIDELDLHLHPRWQHEVVGYLRTRFPGTQFIVTTHSPLIVQASGPDAHVVVLRRDASGAIEAVDDLVSVSTWRMDQILTSELFGLTSARGPEAAHKLDRRRALAQQARRTPREQQELLELDQFTEALPTSERPEDDAALRAIRDLARALAGVQED